MIRVVVPSDSREMMRIGSVSEQEVTQSINDRHRGLVTPGLDRIIAAHWFSDDRIVFVEGAVTEKTVADDERVKLEEVSALFVLLLQTTLPAGVISREMMMPEILRVVASSFGQPLTCHPDEEPRKLYSGRWDGNTINIVGRTDETILSGTFNREKKAVELVWALDLMRYRAWLSAEQATEHVGDMEKQGSVVFWLTHTDQAWWKNEEVYDFGEVKMGDVVVHPRKKADQTIELQISGPFSKRFKFLHSIPECDERGLSVAITWKEPEVRLYLNGQFVEVGNGD